MIHFDKQHLFDFDSGTCSLFGGWMVTGSVTFKL